MDRRNDNDRRDRRNNDNPMRDDDYEFSDALRAGRAVQNQSMRRPESIRESVLPSGINFWNDPRVSDKTDRDKESFLRDKGLSEEEIREVRLRAEEEISRRQPPPPSLNNAPNGIGRATIQGQAVQYIPIPIPSNPSGPMIAPPTFFSRMMGVFQTLAVGAGVLVAGNYAYNQYMMSQGQRGNNPMLTWGGQQNQNQNQYGQPNQQNQQQQNNQQQNNQQQNQLSPQHNGNNNSMGNNNSNNNNPLTPGGQSLLTPSGPMRTPNDTDDSMAVREMKTGMRDMQERMELQSSQLREAVQQLHEIATTQSREASNHTSMGLLLANTRAEQSAQERSIRDELSSIKDMIRDRLGDSTNTSASKTSSSTSNSNTTLSTNSTSALLQTNVDEETKDTKETKENEPVEKTQEEKDAEREIKLQKDLDTHQTQINVAVDAVKTKNEANKLKIAVNMLEMILKNLVENPDVPRYRKIVMTNRQFKKCLADVEGHEDLLTACGFTKNGKNFEWSLLPKSHEVKDEDMVWARKLHEAVLTHARATIKQLSATEKTEKTEQTVSTSSGAVTETSSSSTETIVTPIPPVATNTTASAIVAPVVTALANVVAAAAPIITAPVSTPIATSITSPITTPVTEPVAAINVSTTTTEESAQPVQSPQVTINNTSSEEKVEVSNPEYPLAFQEVMKLVQEGKDPPGIRKIPEQLSSDAQKFLGSTSINPETAAIQAPAAPMVTVPKPWETASQPDIQVLDA